MYIVNLGEIRAPLIAFSGSSVSKESACNVGDLGSIPGLEISLGGGHGNPLQYSCLENPHGQRSLAGYNPWGLQELGMTEAQHNTYNHSVLNNPVKYPRYILLSSYH